MNYYSDGPFEGQVGLAGQAVISLYRSSVQSTVLMQENIPLNV